MVDDAFEPSAAKPLVELKAENTPPEDAVGVVLEAAGVDSFSFGGVEGLDPNPPHVDPGLLAAPSTDGAPNAGVADPSTEGAPNAGAALPSTDGVPNAGEGEVVGADGAPKLVATGNVVGGLLKADVPPPKLPNAPKPFATKEPEVGFEGGVEAGVVDDVANALVRGGVEIGTGVSTTGVVSSIVSSALGVSMDNGEGLGG